MFRYDFRRSGLGFIALNHQQRLHIFADCRARHIFRLVISQSLTRRDNACHFIFMLDKGMIAIIENHIFDGVKNGDF